MEAFWSHHTMFDELWSNTRTRWRTRREGDKRIFVYSNSYTATTNCCIQLLLSKVRRLQWIHKCTCGILKRCFSPFKNTWLLCILRQQIMMSTRQNEVIFYYANRRGMCFLSQCIAGIAAQDWQNKSEGSIGSCPTSILMSVRAKVLPDIGNRA